MFQKYFSDEPRPLLSDWTVDLLNSRSELAAWVDGFGSPLHVVYPDQATENYLQWLNELRTVYGDCQVQFALKACKSASLLRAFALVGAGADVSSAHEMASAFMNLVPAERMSMTGPAKSDYELNLCILHKVAIHIDCIEELNRVLALADGVGGISRLFLRARPITEPGSRFGMTEDQLMACLMLLENTKVDRVGVSFHLNDYQVHTRADQLRFCIAFLRRVCAKCLTPGGIDIGGGYPMRYVQRFDPVAYGQGVHWGNVAKPGNYPYVPELTGAQHAAAVIQTALADPGDRDFLYGHQLPILLQPGRSLLDQCGVSAFHVTDVKDLGDRRFGVVLDGMSFSLSETWFGADFVPSPVVVWREEREVPRYDATYFLVGRSCLESDIIRRRGLTIKGGIARGDLVVFANTAGYQMDSNESSFHQIPSPKKIAAVRRRCGWKILADETLNKQGLPRNDRQ